MNIFTCVLKTEALEARVCFVSLVLVAVCGDDMVGGVPQLVAHEAPGERVRLRISLHLNV